MRIGDRNENQGTYYMLLFFLATFSGKTNYAVLLAVWADNFFCDGNAVYHQR